MNIVTGITEITRMTGMTRVSDMTGMNRLSRMAARLKRFRCLE